MVMYYFNVLQFIQLHLTTHAIMKCNRLLAKHDLRRNIDYSLLTTVPVALGNSILGCGISAHLQNVQILLALYLGNL